MFDDHQPYDGHLMDVCVRVFGYVRVQSNLTILASLPFVPLMVNILCDTRYLHPVFNSLNVSGWATGLYFMITAGNITCCIMQGYSK